MSSPINTKSTPADAQAHPAPTNAQVAHELANLLDGSMRNVNLVRSFLKDQAESEFPTDADVTQRLQSAEQGMRQMASLLRQWLQASQTGAPSTLPRDQSDTATEDLNATSLGHVVDIALRQLLPQAHDNAIELATQVDPTASNLPAGEIFHVITNALRNAIESIAMSPRPVESPRIELTVFPDRDHLVIRIDDNGPGIPSELLDKHGDCRFGESSKPDGHGIGLALCRDIAEKLGGTIRLTNRLPQGAKFTLRFPVAALLK